MGTEVDLHTPHWHGNTLTTPMGMRMDMAELLPGSMLVLNMIPDNPGTWLYHCHVNDHILAGMMTDLRGPLTAAAPSVAGGAARCDPLPRRVARAGSVRRAGGRVTSPAGRFWV